MNQPNLANANEPPNRRNGLAGWIRRAVPGVALFAAGLALSAWWFLRTPPSSPAARVNPGTPALSPATESILAHLQSPIEIRFYSLLDPAGGGDREREFSARIDQLLARYEQEAAGKIKIARVNSVSSMTANAALADGIKPFNQDKGDACFLGLAVLANGRKATVSSLVPQWEAALEADLSRAIGEVDYSPPPTQSRLPEDVASREAVRQAIPNLGSLSVAEGSRQLRIAALSQFRQTAEEMRAKVSQAEERLLQAQNGQTEAAQEAALRDLQQAQKEQAEKLRDIALSSKAQLAALRQLKGDPR